jgi:hypothetical protein
MIGDHQNGAGDATGTRTRSGLLPPHVSALEAVVDRATRFCTVMESGARTELRPLLHVGSARAVSRNARGEACSTCAFEDNEFSCAGDSRRHKGWPKVWARQHCVRDHARALQTSAIESSRHLCHRTIMQSASLDEKLSAWVGRVRRHRDCPERASAPSIRRGAGCHLLPRQIERASAAGPGERSPRRMGAGRYG